MFTAIAWRKKSWCKYFDSEEHDFHKLAHKLLEAPTEAIAHMIQGHIVDWLRSMKETRASSWFESYWTGEHDNYTNARAVYVGNNKSMGCESHWKYARRDTLGIACSIKRISFIVWLLLLIKYLEALSNLKTHVNKILCLESGSLISNGGCHQHQAVG